MVLGVFGQIRTFNPKMQAFERVLDLTRKYSGKGAEKAGQFTFQFDSKSWQFNSFKWL